MRGLVDVNNFTNPLNFVYYAKRAFFQLFLRLLLNSHTTHHTTGHKFRENGGVVYHLHNKASIFVIVAKDYCLWHAKGLISGV